MYIRLCPNCDKEIKHKNEKNCIIANKNEKLCNSCRAKKGHSNEKVYTRKCIQCKNEIRYSNVEIYLNSEKENKKCMSCAVKDANKKPKNFKRNCPWCNKEIYYSTEEQKEIAIENNKPCTKCRNGEISSRPGVNEKRSRAVSGEKNPMFGISVQDKWKEKYGEKEANIREQKWLNSLRRAFSGENNPMYGKPSPRDSGNGWSGHYKGIQFRSLNELFYLKYLLDNNIKFDNAEKKKYRVSYEFNGVRRSYGMDFYLIESDEYIEIKPKKLINSPINTSKFDAAIKIYGDKFKVLTEDDLQQISLDEMWNLYLSGELIFNKRDEGKFLEYYKKVKYFD